MFLFLFCSRFHDGFQSKRHHRVDAQSRTVTGVCNNLVVDGAQLRNIRPVGQHHDGVIYLVPHDGSTIKWTIEKHIRQQPTILVVSWSHPDPVVRRHSAAGDCRQCAGHPDTYPKSTDANHHECVSFKSGRVRYPAGCVVYAVHVDRSTAAGFRVRRGDVQDFALFAR